MMMLPPAREQVIENIRRCVAAGRFHEKVEVGDPQLDPEQLRRHILDYVAQLDGFPFKVRNFIARRLVDLMVFFWSRGTNEIRGMELLDGFEGPAFLTSNHFNPYDNGFLRTLSRKAGRGLLYAVSQGTNFIQPGVPGFILRNIDVIPIIQDPQYMETRFQELLRAQLDRNRFILIYPEQEMWFNYRKPRPLKRGAYLFAARHGVPVISVFTELVDLPRMQAPSFRHVKAVAHVLGILRPDPSRTDRENSFEMCAQDYALKKAAYERCYGKPLDYAFDPQDIAGWTGPSDI